jgi:hypothetical protein
MILISKFQKILVRFLRPDIVVHYPAHCLDHRYRAFGLKYIPTHVDPTGPLFDCIECKIQRISFR